MDFQSRGTEESLLETLGNAWKMKKRKFFLNMMHNGKKLMIYCCCYCFSKFNKVNYRFCGRQCLLIFSKIFVLPKTLSKLFKLIQN